MANVAHSTLTTTDLHESKGVAAAAVNTVAIADGAGSTSFAKLTHSNLTTTGNPFGGQLFHVSDVKSAGTHGGASSSGSWLTRTLNTSVTNEITSASLASNQITLPAGTYQIFAVCVFEADGIIKARFRNVSDNTTVCASMNGLGGSAAVPIGQNLPLYTRMTIASSKVFELQYRVTASIGSTGLGRASNFGESEIYSNVLIWKIA